MNRLRKFTVKRLYGEYDYVIPFNLERHVTAIIAPNGSGKTLCLRLTNALFQQDWFFFENTVYDEIEFEFSDATVISISKAQRSLDLADEDIEPRISVKLVRPNAVSKEWSPSGRKLEAGMIDRFFPYFRRIGPTLWLDKRTNETFNQRDILSLYGQEIMSGSKVFPGYKTDETISDFLSGINCKLIETQRLIVFGDADEQYPYREGKKTRFAISQKAEGLKRIIANEMNKYAALSQSLDRSFPRRALTSQSVSSIDIEEALASLDEKRKQLMKVGILDSDDDHAVGSLGSISQALTGVLSVYIDDNNKKLGALNELYERVRLFKELIDARFGKKDVKISKNKGIDVFYGGQEVPIERLSSGEQHQLVLFFDLLFEVPSNSLILIDEPEISLHVAWQKKFIADLLKIIELNKFDVVLATHSPQLIGRWVDLVVELGDVDDLH